MRLLCTIFCRVPPRSSETRSYTPQTIHKNEGKGVAVVIETETSTDGNGNDVNDDARGSQRRQQPSSSSSSSAWGILDMTGQSLRSLSRLCRMESRVAWGESGEEGGGGGSNAGIYGGGQCGTGSNDALSLYSTSSAPSNDGGMMVIDAVNHIITVTSCQSDAYQDQRALGATSKLPPRAPSTLKTFHELAVGIKDAYEAGGLLDPKAAAQGRWQ
jgi:hypothetical protein